ncbi:hypothetical protein DMUE_4267 [Dictyocoela muelleri]|nr:hypothetical protein DMUE_4267 [Dictyocoela muelleri]
MSKRINQAISRIINCNKQKRKNNKKNNLTLNNTHNRMIGFAPNEVVYCHNELDPIKRRIVYNLKNVIEKSDINKSKSVENMNKKKRHHSFKICDLIFVKNEKCSKEDSNWIRPFKIYKLKFNYAYVEDFDMPINFR